MADVTAAGERAQLLLITAIALGLLLVVLAVMLNTVMYTDALATGGTTDGAERDLLAALDGMDVGIGILLAELNVERSASTASDELEDDAREVIHDWSDQERVHWAHDGAMVDVTVNDVAFFTTIIDDNRSSDFTNTSGEDDWTLIEDGDTIDTLELNVTRDGLIDVNTTCGPDEGCFSLSLEDENNSSSTVHLAERSGEIAVDISTPEGETSCTINADAATIDLVNGTIEGQRCDGLAIVDHHQPPIQLQYTDAANVTGSYVIGFEGTVADRAHFTDDRSPRVIPSVSSVEVAVTYQSARLTYSGTQTIDAGDHDD